MRFTLKNGHWLSDKDQEQGVTVDTNQIKKITTDTIRRVVRTFVQAFVGSLTVSLPTLTVTSSLPVLVSSLTAVGISAAVAGATAVVTLAHNALEDFGKVPSTK